MPNTAHLAAWNLNHRTGRKPAPAAVVGALVALNADVAVLTEYVDGDHQADFKRALQAAGYEHLAVSVWGARQNQVLLASRTAIIDGDLLPLPGYTEAAATNWLHRKIPALGLEVVGMRAPAYKLQRDLKGYWAQVQAILQSASERPLVLIGDVNCDPFSDTSPGSRALRALEGHGYQLSNPGGEYSYFGPTGTRTRIEHVLATQNIQLANPRYQTTARQVRLAAGGGTTALSDHAVLTVGASAKR